MGARGPRGSPRRGAPGRALAACSRPGAELGKEVPAQQLDVAGALAQRRKVQAQDVQPVIEIFTEPPLLDLPGQILVGGSDDANVDRDRMAGPDPLDRLLLQKAEKVRLDVEREVADLVEEDRSAASRFDAPKLALVGAGEGSLLVAEQLGRHQGRRQAGAVDGNERATRRARKFVQRPSRKLLAGAGLAGDQHRGVAGRELPNLFSDPPHRRAVADEH